jgi:fumarate reductase flavoprotein subunit
MEEFKGLSRRDFLKTAASGAAGVAAVSVLAACAPKVATSDPTAAPEAAAPAAECSTDWLGTAPGITDDQVAETFSADVVIVGAGIAGISAARSAAENGASVIVVEKTGAHTVRGLCFGALDSKFQKDLGAEFDKLAVVRDLMQISGNRASEPILRKWANESGAAFDWFEEVLKEDGRDFGYFLAFWPHPENFDNSTEYYRQYCSSIEFTDWVGAVEAQYNKTVALGVEYKFNLTAKELVVDGGAVKGVYAETAEGKIVKVEAGKGLVMATGDYGHNEAMLKALCPEFFLALGNQPTMIETSTGDGHKMLIWAGGQMEPGPHAHMSHAFAGGFSGLGATAALQLNAKGKRYANEDVPGQAFTNQVLRQPAATSWQIWDSNWEDMLLNQSIGHGNMDPHKLDIAGMKERFAASVGVEPAPFACVGANTIEELLTAIGLPVEAGVASIERYNELCHNGVDEDFGKRADRMYPVETGPFFASKAFVAAGVMTAGVMVDDHLRVLDANGDPISGLWAVGNVAGGRYACDYPTTCPATSHGTAVTFGKSVGEEIAKL